MLLPARLLPVALLLAALGLAATAAPAAAADGPAAPALASAYWQGFIDHWRGTLKKQNGIVLATLGVGAISLFIITRGKWQK